MSKSIDDYPELSMLIGLTVPHAEAMLRANPVINKNWGGEICEIKVEDKSWMTLEYNSQQVRVRVKDGVISELICVG